MLLARVSSRCSFWRKIWGCRSIQVAGDDGSIHSAMASPWKLCISIYRCNYESRDSIRSFVPAKFPQEHVTFLPRLPASSAMQMFSHSMYINSTTKREEDSDISRVPKD